MKIQQIRAVRPDDWPRLVEIEQHAGPKSSYGLFELIELGRRYPDTFLVAVAGGIQGYIVFSPTGHVVSMAVAVESRRRGIGRALVEAAARACGIHPLRLEVRVSNLGARAFYRQLGFRQYGRVPGYYHDGEDAILMERFPEGGAKKDWP